MYEDTFDAPTRLHNQNFERRYLEALLAQHNDNVTAAARAPEVDRIHFYRLLWKHGLREHTPEKRAVVSGE